MPRGFSCLANRGTLESVLPRDYSCYGKPRLRAVGANGLFLLWQAAVLEIQYQQFDIDIVLFIYFRGTT
jgi:hypothetical protein